MRADGVGADRRGRARARGRHDDRARARDARPRRRRSRAAPSSSSRPGFEFRRVDHLLTNFHLPRSTLLALVMAFAGIEETRRLYRLAVEERYRFYSFGDAMLILGVGGGGGGAGGGGWPLRGGRGGGGGGEGEGGWEEGGGGRGRRGGGGGWERRSAHRAVDGGCCRPVATPSVLRHTSVQTRDRHDRPAHRPDRSCAAAPSRHRNTAGRSTHQRRQTPDATRPPQGRHLAFIQPACPILARPIAPDTPYPQSRGVSAGRTSGADTGVRGPGR